MVKCKDCGYQVFVELRRNGDLLSRFPKCSKELINSVFMNANPDLDVNCEGFNGLVYPCELNKELGCKDCDWYPCPQTDEYQERQEKARMERIW